MSLHSKRNGKWKHSKGKLWEDDDHILKDWTLQCPHCGRQAEYIATAYDPINCRYCEKTFG